jgi:hypothetical protein
MFGFLVAIVAWICTLGYRRLYLHPLSPFPGPRLATLTRWYGFYYEVIKHGAFLRHKSALHDTYGLVFICRIMPYDLLKFDPGIGNIVRVGPNEVDNYCTLNHSQSLINHAIVSFAA